MPLPSLKKYITPITNQLFVLLNNYAGAGAAKGDNFELVVMCFKVSTLVAYSIINIWMSVIKRVDLFISQSFTHNEQCAATNINIIKYLKLMI